MRLRRFEILLLSLLVIISGCQSVTLVKDGQPKAVIVVPEGTKLLSERNAGRVRQGQSVPLSAIELQTYIEKATGATFNQ